jgi:hypothetical protein
LGRSSFKLAQGELRCEGAGAVIIIVAGTMGALHHPPIQRMWNNATYPETDIDRIIVQGLTLHDWQPVKQSTINARR